MENIEEIEKYLNGEMSAEEKESFEERLASDPVLARDLKRHRELMETLGDEGVIDLLEKLEKLRKKQQRRNRNDDRFKGARFLLMAASVTVLLGMAAVIMYTLIFPGSFEKDRVAMPDLSEEVYQLPGIYASIDAMVIRGTGFRMVRPPDSLMFKQGNEISFLWKYNTEGSLRLTVLNNREKIVHEAIVDHTEWYILESPLDEGIYIYTIEEAGSVVKLGVFFVIP